MAKQYMLVSLLNSATRSAPIVIGKRDRLTGKAFTALDNSVVREVSIEVWDIAELNIQGRAIPAVEGILESALLYKQRGEVSYSSLLTDVIIDKIENTPSAKVLSVVQQTLTPQAFDLWIEVDRIAD